MRRLSSIATLSVAFALTILPALAAPGMNFEWKPGEIVKTSTGAVPVRENSVGGKVRYEITEEGRGEYTDGNDTWMISCVKDAMTDLRNCFMLNMAAKIAVIFGQENEPTLIKLMEHDYPGRTGMIRFDTNAAFETNNEGWIEQPDAFAQLKTAKSIKSRFVTWPNENRIDNASATSGYNEAVDLMKHIRAHVDDMNF